MEDDDGEGSNTESQVLTDSESLKIHHNSTTDSSNFSEDEKEEEKEKNVPEEEAIDDEDDDDDEEEEEEEIYPENFPTRLPNPMSHPVFRGFKRRIPPPPSREQHVEEPVDNNDEDKRSKNPRRGKINEYAQYLGLQPAAKYNKCSKCNVMNSHRRDECLCQSQIVSPCIPEPSPQSPPLPPPPPPLVAKADYQTIQLEE